MHREVKTLDLAEGQLNDGDKVKFIDDVIQVIDFPEWTDAGDRTEQELLGSVDRYPEALSLDKTPDLKYQMTVNLRGLTGVVSDGRDAPDVILDGHIDQLNIWIKLDKEFDFLQYYYNNINICYSDYYSARCLLDLIDNNQKIIKRIN